MVEVVESMLRQPACSRMTSFAGFASFVGAIVSSVFVLCFSGGRYAWCVKGVADLCKRKFRLSPATSPLRCWCVS